MTGRIPSSLAVSVLSHTALIVVAGLLLSFSSLPKIEIPLATANAFVLVTESTSQPNWVHDKAGDPAALVSLPPIPKPAISVRKPETQSDKAPRQTSAVKPAPETQPFTRPPAAITKPQMSFDDFKAAQIKSPVPAGRIVTPVVAPRFPEVIASTPAVGSSSSTSRQDDATNRAFNGELIRRLHEAYKPVGGEDDSLVCRIEFVLGANGRIASFRILKSSGERAFDNAVVAALRRVSVSTPPHALVGAPLTTTFQLKP